MNRDQKCTCPPISDVFRGRAGETSEPCPVHPIPPGLEDVMRPAIVFAATREKINLSSFPTAKPRARRS